MSVKLITYTPNPEEILIKAFSQCYQLEKKGKNPNINVVINNLKHGSVLEHVQYTFECKLSRTALMQLTRHRIGVAYTVESQRYNNYYNGFEYYIPETIANDEYLKEVYKNFMNDIKDFYQFLSDCEVPKEDARYILPNSTMVNFVFSANLRALIHLWKLRLDSHAQKEIKDFAKEIMDITLETLPNLADPIKKLVFDK